MSVQFYVDIDKILENKKMTLTELADKTGIHTAQLSRVKRLKRASFSTLNKIATALNETDLDGLISVTIQGQGKIIN